MTKIEDNMDNKQKEILKKIQTQSPLSGEDLEFLLLTSLLEELQNERTDK